MRLACRLQANAPSTTLLRFLKSQSSDICFFSHNPKPTLVHGNIFQPSKRAATCISLDSPASSTRLFGTYPKRRAAVESSFLNLDFLRHSLRIPPFQNSTDSLNNLNHSQSVSEASRYLSTGHRPFLRRLWNRRRRAQSTLGADERPPFPGFLDEAAGTALGRSKAGKATNELKLRCTELNENGDVTLVNGEFKKSELIAKVCSH